MAAGQRNSPSAVGFLTVVEHSQHGLMGGYLVLNTAGRPLEFHCTAPVKPNRAQQILYGPTLEPYLYGEQIGAALVSKSSLVPLAIFTDREPALAVRMAVEIPLALVLPPVDECAAGKRSLPVPAEGVDAEHRIDPPHTAVGSPRCNAFAFGRNRLSVSADRDADRDSDSRATRGIGRLLRLG